MLKRVSLLHQQGTVNHRDILQVLSSKLIVWIEFIGGGGGRYKMKMSMPDGKMRF